MKLDFGFIVVDDGDQEKEIIINKNTSEELSIVKKPLSNEYLVIKIKRGAQKKN